MEDHRKLAREAVIKVVGREKYAQLLDSLDRRSLDETPRLRYWEETVFEELRETTGIAVDGFPMAKSLLLVCHVHGAPLSRLDGHLVPYEATFSKNYFIAEDELFPHSHEVVFGHASNKTGRPSQVLGCPSCRAARWTWASQQSNKPPEPNPARDT